MSKKIKMHPHDIVLLYHFRKFLIEADKAGIDVAPLKGAHLLTSVYPIDVARGMMADIDFLVRKEDWDATLALLRKLGFVEHQNTGRLATSRDFHEALFQIDLGSFGYVAFEPHRCFAQIARHSIDYDAVWARSQSGDLDGEGCRRLAPEDHFLHGVIHLISHCFVKPARGLRDLELLIRSGVDFDTVVIRAKEWECAIGTWLSLMLLQESAPDLKLDHIATLLAPGKFRQILLRKLVPDCHGYIFENYGLRKKQALLWPWLFDSIKQGLGFISYYASLRVKDLIASIR